MSAAERSLWQCLRGGQLNGAHFRHLYPIGPHVVDFYCHKAGLVIQVDGDGFDAPEELERERARWFAENTDLRILHCSVRQIAEDLGGVIDAVRAALEDNEAR